MKLRTAVWLAFAVAAPVGVAAPAMGDSGVAHLAFDKSAKMKKIGATLFLPPDAADGRALRCGVIARGKSGAIAVAGTLSVRLLGESAGGNAVWRSDPLASAVDELGDTRFAPGDLEGLAAAAPGDAEIRLIEVGFKGGRGGRVTELTLDCLPEEES